MLLPGREDRAVTPQTDAARAGITGFLDALDPRVDTILTLERADRSVPLKASHLRLVLAALDRHERATDPSTWREPCNIALSHTNGEITCQLAVADPLPGGRYTGNRNHWEKHWHQDEHGQVRTWTDNESEG